MMVLCDGILPRLAFQRWMIALATACLLAPALGQEVELANDDKNKMDPFEEHSLGKADKAFKARQYRTAAAEYDSFLIEFPQSRVRAYALFRKARSIDLDNKRFDAIKKYNEVLDYFPTAIPYAAGALYYMGQGYMDTGDPENAIKAWVEMVQDKDYRKHFLAASALNKLAENSWKEKNYEKTLEFYEQVVADFRTANPQAAKTAMEKVIEYRMKISPDESRLRAFYIKAMGFNDQPQKIAGDPVGAPAYWSFIRSQVRKFGAQFNDTQASARRQFYRYWSDAMEGKFPDNDDFQIDYIDFRYAQENNLEKRVQRLDTQFAKYQKPGNATRIIKWLNLYLGNKAKINEYYAKLDLSKLGQADTEQLVFALLAQKEYAMALNAFDKLLFKDMTDAAREAFARRLWDSTKAGFSITALERVADSFTDKEYGTMVLIRYYYSTGNLAASLSLAEKLKTSPKFATEVLTIMGDLYLGAGQYEKAIPCYQQANNPPSTLFKTADCYSRMGKVDSAVATLREVENFFVKDAPRAAMTIASLYQKAGLSDKHVAALRALIKKYPGSSESSAAHQELEKLGLKTGGGVDT
ncbi:MAG: tetratricopeptide repeat protein [Verrucomicrobia bacterium]|nr:tetratricopeptide repeat protein [Verrucomicrobiota bacterium]MBU4429458.1 tetratricopeptide repeat protein [Verrucomicrobiota bacterium]MCG2681553.1 tetratricopeptide repeat protein [Kiritimatiellia bacterium]